MIRGQVSARLKATPFKATHHRASLDWTAEGGCPYISDYSSAIVLLRATKLAVAVSLRWPVVRGWFVARAGLLPRWWLSKRNFNVPSGVNWAPR